MVQSSCKLEKNVTSDKCYYQKMDLLPVGGKYNAKLDIFLRCTKFSLEVDWKEW